MKALCPFRCCLLTLSAWLCIPALLCDGDALDNWTQSKIITNNLSPMGSLYGVTYANGQFVAVGGTGDPGFLQTSVDGVNWVMRFSNSLTSLSFMMSFITVGCSWP